jgi:Protein of unknown function (DUF3431)
MRIDVVVARYREDISWLSDPVFNTYNVFVYNKYEQSGLVLPNVGRESHTYVHHIVQQFDNLADVTAFAQGDPFDHCPAFIKDMHGLPLVKKFEPFSHHKPDGFVCDLAGLPHHFGGLPVMSDYQFLFQKPPVSSCIRFFPGAMFAVPKELIWARGLGFYKRLLARLCDPSEILLGYTMERLWPLILGEPEFAPLGRRFPERLWQTFPFFGTSK